MTVWRVGMLAVCVDASRRFPGNTSADLLTPGNVYRVVDVVSDGGPCLVLQELVSHAYSGGFAQRRFRPAVEDGEACEAEFKTLLKRTQPVLTPKRHERVGYRG